MERFNPPIVQAKFFHISNFGAASLDEVSAEAMDRAREGPRAKTVVRFYDSGEVLLRLHRESQLRQLEERLASKYPARGLWRWWLNMRHRAITKALRRLQKTRVAFLAEQVAETLQDEKIMLVEGVDLVFRLLRLDQRHELLESIRRSPAVWVFLFDHNDLGADKNKLLVSAT